MSLGDSVSKENNAYVELTATTLSRRLTNSIDLHLNTHSIPKSKFPKIQVENIAIITHEIDKLRLQILEAQHIKTKNKTKPRINRIDFENSDKVLKYLEIFVYNIPYLLIIFYFC